MSSAIHRDISYPNSVCRIIWNEKQYWFETNTRHGFDIHTQEGNMCLLLQIKTVQIFCLLDNWFLNDISIILKTDMFDLFYVGLSPFFRFLPVRLSIHHKRLHAHLIVHFNCEVLKIVHACLLSYEICISFSSLIHLVWRS